MPKKIQLRLFIGIVISVIIIYYSVKAMGGLNPAAIFRMKINWGIAMLSAAVFAFSNYVRALCYTRGIDHSIDRMSAFRIVGIGHSANMVLPLHAGEGLRYPFFPSSYSMAARTRLVLIPGVVDFAAILLLSALAVPLAGFKNKSLVHALGLITLIFIAVIALAALVIALVPRLRKHAERYMNRGFFGMLFWIFLSWAVMLLSIWMGLLSFGYSPEESFRMSFSVFAATNIITFIPASPGGLGLFEYGTVLGLGGIGIAANVAKNVGLFLHLLQYIAMLPLGLVLYLTSVRNKKIKPPNFSRKRRKSRIY